MPFFRSEQRSSTSTRLHLSPRLRVCPIVFPFALAFILCCLCHLHQPLLPLLPSSTFIVTSTLQGYFDVHQEYCNILRTSEPKPLEILVAESQNAKLQPYLSGV